MYITKPWDTLIALACSWEIEAAALLDIARINPSIDYLVAEEWAKNNEIVAHQLRSREDIERSVLNSVLVNRTIVYKRRVTPQQQTEAESKDKENMDIE